MKVAQNQKRTLVMAPSAAATATRSATMDTLGADYATLEVAIGPLPNLTVASTLTIAITEGDVATGSFATFNSDFSKTVDIGTVGKVIAFNINCDGTRKRFMKIVTTPLTTATADAIAISAIGVLNSEISPLGTVGQADVVVIG